MSVVLFSFSLSLISYDFSHCSRRLVLIAEVLISFGFSDSFRGGGSLHLIFCIKKISSVLLSNMIKKNLKKTKEKKKNIRFRAQKKIEKEKSHGLRKKGNVERGK